MRKGILLFCLLAILANQSFGQSGVSFSSSNLPIIVINTNGQYIRDEPKIIASMGIVSNGNGVRNNLTDAFQYSGKIGIEIRGSSSQMFPKKQYGIEIVDDAGVETDTVLLGMPSESDWILFAPYNDKSLMRDALAYRLGRAMGRYAPRTRFCELVLNGSYQGIYVLMEKIKRDKNRVDINKLNPDENEGNNLTGGYILKIDKSSGNSGEGWQSLIQPTPRTGNQQISFQFETPNYNVVTSQQRQYIKTYVTQFENALTSVTFQDPAEGYQKFIDVDSFVDFYLMQELTKNVDGYRLSTFLYKERDSDGGKLFMGPLWDFNLGFGNADYCTKGNPEGFVLDFNNTCPQDFWLIPFWWKRLLEDATFRGKVADRWASLRESVFSQPYIHNYIDSVAGVLNVEARQRNFNAWPVLGTYVWPNFYVGQTYGDEVLWLKNWVTQRLLWLDSSLPKSITGVEERAENELIVAYPNPFANEVNFQINSSEPGVPLLTVVDVLGRTIHSDQMSPQEGGSFSYRWTPSIPSQLLFYSIEVNGKPFARGRVFKK